MTPFQKPGIFGRVNTIGVQETLDALIQLLQKNTIPFCIEAETATRLSQQTAHPTISKDYLNEHCDLLIVVGGDGSLLHAAHIAVEQQLPVLGINRGNLGFLTDILPDNLSRILPILAGQYRQEKRFLLDATVQTTDIKHTAHDNALNEVAIIPDAFPHMSEFEIYVNEQFVCSMSADGLIIATPTGSTAYALSGGGPILHPELDAIALIPMFPHSLTSRPIVITGNSQLRIVLDKNSRTIPRLSCDGRTCIDLHAGAEVHIQKKQAALQLIHPSDYDYYEALRSKLHWGKQLARKEPPHVTTR